jgi:hypothetical protein
MKKSALSATLPVARGAITTTLAAAMMLATFFVGPAAASTLLKLINGWTNAPFATHVATVEAVGGIVRFQGAIATTGTNPEPFVLPAAFRPVTNVYVPVDLCDATNGRLHIQSNGNVTVEAETGFSNAQCFTSLDGASFAKSANLFTPLALVHGWVNAPFQTSDAAVRIIGGVVQFKGAIATRGTSPLPFHLPSTFRPSTDVYVKVDLCNSANGRLFIQPSGVVTVEAENTFTDAQCFTSLDGASFALSSFQALTLRNGWTGGPFSTARPAIRAINGVVHFKGAMATSGTNAEPFVLPLAFRPSTSVYVPVDMCNATNGRLFIQPKGVVEVEAETKFSNAQCFTSLDGVTFVP